MNPTKKIWYDENSEPPKNYIWVKNGIIWQFNKYLRKWVEYKNKDEDHEQLDLIKYGELFSGYIITPEEFESGSYLSKYKSIRDRLNQYNETYDFESKLVDGVYIRPYDLDDDYQALSYTVLPFEIEDMPDESMLDLSFHMASEKSIEKMLSTPHQYTTEFAELRDNVFENKAGVSVNVEYSSEENIYRGFLNNQYFSIRDGLSNLYINNAVINLYNDLSDNRYDGELFGDSGGKIIFFDLPDNIATVDNVDKLRTAMNELNNIYRE